MVWAVIAEYAQCGSTKRIPETFKQPADAELGSIGICGYPETGKGSTQISVGPKDADSEEQAREIGVRAANVWAEALGIRPEPVNVEVRPVVSVPEPTTVG